MRRLVLLFRYLRQFRAAGFAVWLGSLFRQEAELRVAQLGHPFTLRRQYSDWRVFDDLFLWNFYQLPGELNPKVIVDAGANIGLVSALWATMFPEAIIYAIEPAAENFALLKRNTGKYPNVVAIQAALWPRQEKLNIRNPEAESWAFEVEISADGGLAVVTMQEILERSGATAIDILKIDIEGAEKELFGDESAAQWLGAVRTLFIETHDRFKPGSSRAVFARVTALDFEQSITGDALRFDFRRSDRVGIG